MTKQRIIKKSKDTTNIVEDITKAFTILSKKETLYMITLDGIPTPHIQD
jgi:hypothetical protein